ncbi:hypothetical protein CLU79DRAFT_769441 [Phycomyces nitens]|nr:hypothetical protein CLU79DRAFT_769441 [Phycomyces nitens]
MGGLVNRTIVLPNVKNSRLGACLRHPFDFYYSNSWGKQNKDHFNTITMADFTAWLTERKALGHAGINRNIHIRVDPTTGNPYMSPQNCLDPLLAPRDLPDRLLLMKEHRQPELRLDIERQVFEFLTEDQDIEVLGLFYDRRYPFVHHPLSNLPIPYNERVTGFADQIASSLGPYRAVHWRTETLEPAENLVECAQTLVDKLTSEIGEDGMPHKLFLLTDYPHTFSEQAIYSAISKNITDPTQMRSASATFTLKMLTTHHHKAMAYLYSHVPVRVTSLEETRNSHMGPPPANWTSISVPNEVGKQDSGLLGIVDKLLAMRADSFLAGVPHVCGRSSSFTTQIVEARKEAMLEGAILSNSVEYFGLPSTV